MHEEADPIDLLERKDRLPERDKRHKDEPLHCGCEERPRSGEEQDRDWRQPRRPPTEQPEEGEHP
jgi:hypothetical protein